jgi:hypothetical protein
MPHLTISEARAELLEQLEQQSDRRAAQQALDRQTAAQPDPWTTLTLPRNIAMHPHGRPWLPFARTTTGYVERPPLPIPR